jgi:LytS/YehU family sensor histidine kinase
VVAEEESRLGITVADNGIGPLADTNLMKTGIGLASTCERMTRMYPEQHQFSIRPLSEGGTEIRTVIPLRFANPADHVSAYEEIPALNRR